MKDMIGMEAKHPPYKLHETTPAALQKMRAHKMCYEITTGNLTITVFPGVWSPAYDWSGEFMISNFPNVKDKDVLEIGCGSGLISLYAAQAGAKRVTAVDINPKAVENTLLNFKTHAIHNGIAFHSDGFREITGMFDIIIFNAP
jgi:release factor glutamine methyltransferase